MIVDVLLERDISATESKVPELFVAAKRRGEARLEPATGEVLNPVWASFCCAGLDNSIS